MKTCRDSGMRDVVPKPINKKCLLEKIRQWISESQTVKVRPPGMVTRVLLRMHVVSIM
jgi:hypothetical protein